MPNQTENYFDLEMIKNFLFKFIREHKDGASMAGLSLSEDSVNGRKVIERSDLCFLGDWVIRGVPAKFTAHWSSGTGPGYSDMVTVYIERIEDNLVVRHWNVLQTF
jgi:hypothetical protein